MKRQRNGQKTSQLIVHSFLAIAYLLSLVSQLFGFSNVNFNKYNVIVSPITTLFISWGVVYLLTVTFIVWQFFEQLYEPMIIDFIFNALLMAAFVMAGIWVHLLGFNNMQPQFFIMLQYALLITGTSLLARFRHVRPFVRFVADVHTSWVLFALAFSFVYYLKYTIWTTETSPDASLVVDQQHENIYSLGLIFLVLLQGALSLICASFAFGLVSLWICSWISVELMQRTPLHTMTYLKFSAGSGVLISIGMTIIGIFMFQNLLADERFKQERLYNEQLDSEAKGFLSQLIDEPDANKEIGQKIVDAIEPTPVIIETPSIPHSDASILA